MFNYNQDEPLDVREEAVQSSRGCTVHDISYASPWGGRVPAWQVVPENQPGPGRFAGLIYMHPAQGNRDTFRPEAESLAAAGVVSLLIDAPFLRPQFERGPGGPRPAEEAARAEAGLYRQLVIDLRRGVDLLSARPDVNPRRIGYVGHSLGATWGGPLAGTEKRLKALVLMAGYPSLTEAYRTNPHSTMVEFRSRFEPQRLEAFLAILALFDAVHFIRKAAPAALLFQFATRDEWITKDDAEGYFAAASEPKEIRWYDCDHFFTVATEAARDRARWLGKQLGSRARCRKGPAAFQAS